MIGKELRNELTNTWINYAIPFNASIEVPDKDGKKIDDQHPERGHWRRRSTSRSAKAAKTEAVAYHGIVLVPNVVDRTPPYIEEVVPARRPTRPSSGRTT